MKTITLILALYINLGISAQNDLKYASYNVVFNSLVSGFGSAIHHKSNESFFHAFVQGSYKGAIGGALNYSGIKLVQVSAINNNYNLIWPGKLVNSLGTSINCNAAENKGMFSSFQMNFYFVNLNYNGKLHCKIDPLTLGYTTYLSFKKDMSFNLKTTLETGSILFDQKSNSTIFDGGLPKGIFGTSLANSAYIKPTQEYFYDFYKGKLLVGNQTINTIKQTQTIRDISIPTTCHELIHTMQYEQSYSINYLTNKFDNKYIYINFEFCTLYLAANVNGYNNNYFEHEADYFGNSNYLITNTKYH